MVECKKSTDNVVNSGGGNANSDVRVTTYTPQDVTASSVVCGGDVIVTQGLSLSEIGVCWSTESNSTAADPHLSTTEWGAPFVCTITGLSPNTKYYVRAYALRGLEYYYGDEKTFTTEEIPTPPIGAFSVSATHQVYFSQGNLQYQASTNTWRFAENQWDYIGDDNSNISSSYSGWIDLFGWGTSGYNHGAVCYQPWSTSINTSDYYAYGSYTYNLNDQTGQADWGCNAISNGGNTTNIWRTLTKDEWVYLFDYRSTISGIRYAKAEVNNINGVILLPDDWNSSIYSLNDTNIGDVYFSSNTITSSVWTTTFEANGAVFLPVAGSRYGTLIYSAGFLGYYWSSTSYNSSTVYSLYLDYSNVNPSSNDYYDVRYTGCSVRLVMEL